MKKIFVACITAFACFAASAAADSTSKHVVKTAASYDPAKEHACVDMVKNCFARLPEDRSSCFYVASRASQCTNTETGALSYKRWALDPVPTGNAEPPPAFMGPRLVDRDCLANFDNRWSSELLRGDSTIASVKQLGDQLERCYKETAIDISRP
jgi:hypothetical protein